MLDFCCPACESTEEHFVDSSTEFVSCACGELAFRMISAPQIRLEGITGAFPGAAEKWAKVREDKARIEAKKKAA